MSFAVVVSDIAPLYTKPEPLCELADEALYGMVVEVLAREGMYCRVRTHYRYEGWTPARCLLEDGAPAAQWQSVPKLVVQKPYIDVLNEPKVQGGCLQSMPRGAFLCPEGGPDENQWQPVRLADGRLGYTKATYLAQPAPAWESVGEDELRQRKMAANNAAMYAAFSTQNSSSANMAVGGKGGGMDIGNAQKIAAYNLLMNDRD